MLISLLHSILSCCQKCICCWPCFSTWRAVKSSACWSSPVTLPKTCALLDPSWLFRDGCIAASSSRGMQGAAVFTSMASTRRLQTARGVRWSNRQFSRFRFHQSILVLLQFLQKQRACVMLCIDCHSMTPVQCYLVKCAVGGGGGGLLLVLVAMIWLLARSRTILSGAFFLHCIAPCRTLATMS